MADDTTRLWRVPMDPESGEVDLDVFGETLTELGGILRRAGGACKLIARRREVRPGVYVTESISVGWTLHAPLPRRREDVDLPVEPEALERDEAAPVEAPEEAPVFDDEEDRLLAEQEEALLALDGGNGAG